MTNKLVLGHVGMGTGTWKPFDQVFPKCEYVRSEDIKDGFNIDALVIWGGEDISPSLYGDAVADLCGADACLSQRDRVEASTMAECIDKGIPIIGVCRGAQLACAVAGGRLIQHVNRHAGGRHSMTTIDGHNIMTSSVHHQMMYPFDVDHKMIAWSSEKRSDVYIVGNNESDPLMESKPEPEIVWFPRIKALAIQGHPEFHANPETDEFVQYCMKLVREFVLNETSSDVNRVGA